MFRSLCEKNPGHTGGAARCSSYRRLTKSAKAQGTKRMMFPLLLPCAADRMGGGSETLIVDTLVFDEGQITCPTNGLNPKWGGQPHRSLETPDEPW